MLEARLSETPRFMKTRRRLVQPLSLARAGGLGLILTLSLACGNGPIQPIPQDAAVGEQVEQSLLDFYVENSMLHQSERYSAEVVADPAQWNGPYMKPEPEFLKRVATTKLTLYPRAIIPAPGESVLQTLASSELWAALREMGIDVMHTIAIEQAGQLNGREFLPSQDGGFDRISLAIEPLFGTEDDVRNLVKTARDNDAILAGDVIPLHTGLGADFRLATMSYQDYPGIYDMIEIPEEDWGLLPEVSDEWGFEVIDEEQAQPLLERGYIPGVYGVLLADPEAVNWSGWAATGKVLGADGVERRWIYGHLFKPVQPMLNWMDPTYAGRRIQAGDVVRHVNDLGMQLIRLDAVPFLGLEPIRDEPGAETFHTELAVMGTNDLAFLHRKLGAWTWVELNVPISQFEEYMEHGPDAGYDFFTRAQTVHPLITQDARVLRIAHQLLVERGIDHGRLIHEMQNHDEITYQLINLSAQGELQYGDETISGQELAEQVRETMRSSVARDAAPYNKLYRPAEDGVATTYAGFIGPALGIDPYSASGSELETIRRAHVLIAHATAMQPGIFALSQWDLVGALPLPEDKVADERTAEGDVRWYNRGAVDFLERSEESSSPFGLSEAQRLYPSIRDQLDDPSSFASQVKKLIQARKDYGIAFAEMVDIPQVENDAVIVYVMKLPGSGVAVTALNYGRESTETSVDLTSALDDSSSAESPRDIVNDTDVGSLDGTRLTLPLEALSGRTLVIGARNGSEQPDGDGSGGGPSDGNGNGSGQPEGDGSGSGQSDGNGSGNGQPDQEGSGGGQPDTEGSGSGTET